MRYGSAVTLVLLFLVAVLPSPGHAAYRIGVEQLQPETPVPGDTVVFKVTLVNEASWSDVIHVEVVSSDGVVYPLSTIRYRAGDYIPSTAYVSFDIPEDALAGNYTLSIRSDDRVYNEAKFYVFERVVSGFYIRTGFDNGTLRVAVSSPHVIRGLGVELLSQLRRQVEAEGEAVRTAFIPVDFRPLGQSYHYLGDVREAEVSFSLVPGAGYIVVPVKVTWEGGERVVTWSGMVEGVAEEGAGPGIVPVAEASPVEEAPGESLGLKELLLSLMVFSVILPSALIELGQLIRKKSSRSARLARQRKSIFAGDEGEVAEKWGWVEECLRGVLRLYESGMIAMDELVASLEEQLSPREAAAVLGFLLKNGAVVRDGRRYRVVEDWKRKL